MRRKLLYMPALWLLLLCGLSLPTRAQVIISELCDPDSFPAIGRFIEITNVSCSPVNLNGWKVVIVTNYLNSDQTLSDVPLSGIIPPLGSQVIAANSNASFPHQYTFPLGVVSNWNGQYRDGALLYNGNTLIDNALEGTPGNALLYANSTMRRNPNICQGSSTFNINQWDITPVSTATTAPASPGSHSFNCPSSTLVSLAPNDWNFCVYEPDFPLYGGAPANGFYTINGTPATIFSPSALGQGSYSIQYFHINGCGDTLGPSGSHTFNVHPQPTVTLTWPHSALCTNEASIPLSGGTPAGGSYSINNQAATVFNPAALGTGTHTIRYSYSDNNGCSDTATATTTVNTFYNVSFTLPFDTVCVNQSPYSLIGTPAGGVFWGDGVSGTSYTPSGVGIDTIYYAHPPCSDTVAKYVVVAPDLSAGLNGNGTVCGNFNQVNLFQMLNGSPSLGGFWTSPTGATFTNHNINPSTSPSGIYTYTVSNICGTKTAQVNLNILAPINADAGPDLYINPGQTATLLGTAGPVASGPFVYAWSPSTFLVDSSVAQPTTIPLNATTTFTVYVYNVAAGCQDTSQVTVFVSQGVLNVNAVTSNPVICPGNTAQLFAVTSGGFGNYQYSWNPAVSLNDATSGMPLASPTSTTVYTVTVTDGVFSDVSQVQIQVNTPATVVFPAIPNVCINSGPQNINLGVNPPGGQFSGPGITNQIAGIFNPVAAGVGTHTLTYTTTDQNGCVVSGTQTITVQPMPMATVSPIGPFCSNSPSFVLQNVSPPGGNYLGGAVSNNTFNPALANLGNNTIVYSFSDTLTGCTNNVSFVVVVNAAPLVSFGNLPTFCESAAPYTLTSGIPAGGTYSGPGVVNGIFYADSVGAGTYFLQYTVNTSNGCSASATQMVIVNPVPTVFIPDQPDLCKNAGPTLIVGATPSNVTYSGLGVNNGIINPAQLTPGVHQIVVTLIAPSGCVATDTALITILPAPSVSFSPISPICINNGPYTLGGANPPGGTFQGPGVSNGVFDPLVAGTGIHTLTYQVIDTNGCVGIASQTVSVVSAPAIYLSSIPPVCPNSSPFVLNGATPPGGTFFGPGITNNIFDPQAAGYGQHLIYYTVMNQGGCVDTATQIVSVLNVPFINFPPLPNRCINSGPTFITMGSPTGGTYFGAGVSNGQFNPVTAGLGTHTIGYTYTNSQGCVDTAYSSITVIPAPQVSFNPPAPICSNAAPIAMSGGFPAGGNYSGPGIVNNTLNPAAAGQGYHNITYTYTDSAGCTSSATAIIQVVMPAIILLNQFQPICVNASPIPLYGGLPAGGTYLGQGVTNNVFDPAAAGVGQHLIGYTIVDAMGCQDTVWNYISVMNYTAVIFSTPSDLCIDDAPAIITSGVPAGGSYSGPGMIGMYFFPNLAGIGTHVLTYTFNNASGCTFSDTTTITVHGLPSVSFTGPLPTLCENDSGFALFGGNPAGGFYSGKGVSNNFFNPAVAREGYHVLKYTYTDGNGCVNHDTTLIQVYMSPPVPIITTFNNYLICNWGFYQYQWYLDGVAIPGANAQNYVMTQGGVYSVQITNQFGCSNISNNYPLSPIRIEELEGSNILVYPNPSRGEFVVSISSGKGGKLILTNLLGQSLLEMNLENGNTEYTIRYPEHTASGMYLLHLITEDKKTTRKLILER